MPKVRSASILPPDAGSPPDLDEGSWGGGGSGWVELTKAANDIDAHLLTGMLVESGIDTKTVTDRGAPGDWVYGGSNPWAPVTIFVRRLQLEDARIVLAELAFEAPAATRFERTRGRGGPVLWWALAIGLGLFFTALFYFGTQESMDRCRDSGACTSEER
jgi:hypothetical protein